MGRTKRNRGNEVKLLTRQQKLSDSDQNLENRNVGRINCWGKLISEFYTAKRHLRADGLSLLPSALRPRLVGDSSAKSTSFSLIAVAAFGLLLSFFFQTSYVSNASAVSLTLTVPSAPLSVNLNPNTDNGFAKSSDSTISVSTGADWGYELSVKAKDNNTLKNGSSILSSITSSIDENTFKSGTTYNNKWGFKPSKVNGSANSNFIAGPTTSPIIIEKTSAKGDVAGIIPPTQYTIAIGAKADNTLATGTYSNNFTFTATANTVSYSITYNLNEGSWSGESPQTGSTIEKTIKLDSNTPTKDSYEFLGWCTASTSTDTCAGTTYQPGNDIDLNDRSNNIQLWARWKSSVSNELLTQQYTSYSDNVTVKAGNGIDMIMVADGNDKWKPYYAIAGSDVTFSSANGRKYILTIVPSSGNVLAKLEKTADGTITATGTSGSYTSMQDFSDCNTNGANVTDVRNKISYTVAKIGSSCWMLSNLRLDAGIELDPATSDVKSTGFITPTEWASESAKPRMHGCHGQVGNKTGGNCDKTQNKIVTEYYYNFSAAKANPNSSNKGDEAYDNQALGSICPKNWTLPDYSDDVIPTNAWGNGTNPGMLITSGHYGGGQDNGDQYSIGSTGNWWSPTRMDHMDAYFLYFWGASASRIGFSDGGYFRNWGYSVRCMMRNE